MKLADSEEKSNIHANMAAWPVARGNEKTAQPLLPDHAVFPVNSCGQRTVEYFFLLTCLLHCRNHNILS